MKKRKVKMIRFRPELFWDVDPKTIDPKKHARYIIERILDFGTIKEARWLFNTYPRRIIKETIDQPRSVLQNKTKALWSLVVK